MVAYFFIKTGVNSRPFQINWQNIFYTKHAFKWNRDQHIKVIIPFVFNALCVFCSMGLTRHFYLYLFE